MTCDCFIYVTLLFQCFNDLILYIYIYIFFLFGCVYDTKTGDSKSMCRTQWRDQIVVRTSRAEEAES